MKQPQVVEVRIWGERVGAIAASPAHRNAYVFEYDPAWVKQGVELAPLTMPLDGPGKFIFPGLPGETYHGLPGLVADALPDRFGNALVDAWMAQRGVSKDEITALDRLAYMGRRGMGALEIRPMYGPGVESKTALDMQALVEGARRAVQGTLSDPAAQHQALEDIIRVGTSAGGARAKAVVAWNPATDEVRSGQFDCAPGFEHWLLKFDGVGVDEELGASQGYGRIEYAYHLMAIEAGVEMMPCRLLEENGRAHFMTKRFDRMGNEKVHIQTLCALDHLDYNLIGVHSYEQLFQAAVVIGIADEGLTQLFSRMAFNVLASNNDDHTKNFAFMLRKNSEWEVAPAYDLTFAYRPTSKWTRQHLMGVNGRFSGIGLDDFKTVADRFMIPGWKEALNRVKDAVGQWPRFSLEAGVLPRDAKAIGERLAQVGLSRSSKPRLR